MNRSVIQNICVLILFIIIGTLVYANTIETPFVFDDILRIKENPYIRINKLTISNLVQAVFNKTSSASRPVGNLSFVLNYYFHQYTLPGYHIVNIIVHLLAAYFLYFFFRTTLSLPILNSRYRHPEAVAFMAALIWLVHPLHTQSVTYIVQRLNSMAAMFYVLSLWLYVKGRLVEANHKSWPWFTGAVIAGILALGSKQNAAMLPFFIFMYEWYFFQDLDRNWAKRNMKLFFGAFLLFCITALIFLGTSPLEKLKSINDFANQEFTLAERVLTQPRVVMYYLSLLFFPHPSRLNLDYDFPLSHSFIDPVTTVFAFGAVIGLIGLSIYLANRERLLSFCILWFLGNLIIESSVIPLAIIFEHRTYLPSMLFCLMVAVLVSRHITPKWTGVVLTCIAATVFSFWTYQRNKVWSDPVALWNDCVKKSPQKARPYTNLGFALDKQGRTEEAIKHYLLALRIKPDFKEAHNNLGDALDKQGRTEEAIEHYLLALQIKPDFEEAHNNLGNALDKQGRTEEAIEHYLLALQIKPDFVDVHNNLGNSLLKQGRASEALEHFNEALQLNPKFVAAYNSLAVALIRMGKLDEAIDYLQKALHINPEDPDTLVNLGGALITRGRIDVAIVHLRKALKRKPGLPKAHMNLGIALANTGKIENAITHLQKALQIDPNNAEAQHNLNNILATLEKIDREISNIQAELMLAPEDPMLHYSLGDLYKMKGQWDTAEDYYKKAVSLRSEFPEALYELAKLYISRGEYPKALSLYEKILTYLPDNPAVAYNIACIYAKQNKPEASVAWLKKAVSRGFDDWKHIKTDSDLENIRSSIQYKAFIEGR